jgi:hypothetical protein
MKFAHKTRLPGLELILSFDGPEQATAVPFEKFLLGLSRTKKHQAASRRPSCSWRPAVNI